MQPKVSFVLLPYLILTALTYLLYCLSGIQFPFYQLLVSSLPNTVLEHGRLLGIYALSGKISLVYWYVPFIFCIFLLSPNFLSYSRANVWLRAALLFGALCLASVVHRPIHNFNVFHSIVYFTPIYLLGINVAVGWEYFKQPLQKFYILFGAAAIVLAGLQAYFSDVVGNSHKQTLFAISGFDYMIWQKVFLILFLLGLCLKLQHIKIPTLTLLGATSFAIYFLHFGILRMATHLPFTAFLSPDNAFFRWIYMLVIVLGFSVVTPVLLKRFLGRRSRYLVGY